MKAIQRLTTAFIATILTLSGVAVAANLAAKPVSAVTVPPPHFIFNQGPTPTEQKATAALGYNTTCSWALSDTQVRTIVQNNRNDPKFSGIYYISDEPHTAICPTGPQALAARTALIKSVDPKAKTFAVIQWTSSTNEYANFAHSVDYIGVDPYPCNVSAPGCDMAALTTKVKQAVRAVGAARVAPIFQTFGQQCNTRSSHYYRLPTPAELNTMLRIYDRLVPVSQRPFDGSYGWLNQSTSCPTLKDANGKNGRPNLQNVMRNYFTKMRNSSVVDSAVLFD